MSTAGEGEQSERRRRWRREQRESEDMYGCAFSAFRFEAKGAMRAALESAENLELSLQTELSQEEQALTRPRRCHDHQEAQGPGYGHLETATTTSTTTRLTATVISLASRSA